MEVSDFPYFHYFELCCNILNITESEREVIQLCPTFCDPMDCSLPGSSVPVHGIFQARVLEWVAISFSRNITEQYTKPENFTCKIKILNFFFAAPQLINFLASLQTYSFQPKPFLSTAFQAPDLRQLTTRDSVSHSVIALSPLI